MGVGSAIKTVFKVICKYAAQNPVQTAGIVAGAAGAVGVSVGTGNAMVANSTNKKAAAIYNAAIKTYEHSEEQVDIVLSTLAEKQLTAASLFEVFSDLIERIQQRPEGLFQGERFDSIPTYDAKEFKILSNNARIILDTLGGATLGTAAGAAVAGLQPATLGFSAFTAGIVLAIKGISLRKKAEENYQRAEVTKQEVDSIVCFHSLLMEAAGQIVESINRILPLFESHLDQLKRIVSHSTDWNEYSEGEEIIIANSILLACCLNGLCTICLTRKIGNRDVVDSTKVLLLKEKSQEIISIIESNSFGNAQVATAEL